MEAVSARNKGVILTGQTRLRFGSVWFTLVHARSKSLRFRTKPNRDRSKSRFQSPSTKIRETGMSFYESPLNPIRALPVDMRPHAQGKEKWGGPSVRIWGHGMRGPCPVGSRGKAARQCRLGAIGRLITPLN